jgi:hypothetical protein
MPIIFYLLLCILIVVVIVFFYKLIITVDKTNAMLDDVSIKVKKLDNFFDVLDRGSDIISAITNRATDGIANLFLKFFKKKRKDEDYE